MYPTWMSNKFGNFEFHNQEEFDLFQKNCKHESTSTQRGCDGVVVAEQTFCDRCGLLLKDERQEVWGDACV